MATTSQWLGPAPCTAWGTAGLATCLLTLLCRPPAGGPEAAALRGAGERSSPHRTCSRCRCRCANYCAAWSTRRWPLAPAAPAWTRDHHTSQGTHARSWDLLSSDGHVLSPVHRPGHSVLPQPHPALIARAHTAFPSSPGLQPPGPAALLHVPPPPPGILPTGAHLACGLQGEDHFRARKLSLPSACPGAAGPGQLRAEGPRAEVEPRAHGTDAQGT